MYLRMYVFAKILQIERKKENGLKLFEIILSSLHFPPMDSVFGAMMVACEAVGARAVVLPCGRYTFYVVDRTELGT